MNYSNTTKRQVRLLHSINQYPVREWYFSMSPEENLLQILIDIEKLLDKHKRARKLKPMYQTSILRLYNSLEPLFVEYNIDKRKSIYKQYKQLPFILFANKIL